MKCDEAIGLIHLNAEGELSAAETEDLQAHLRTCKQCVTEARLVNHTDRFLKSLRSSTPTIAGPMELTKSIMNAVLGGPRERSIRPRENALDAMLDVLLQPAVRYAYAALVLFFVALFMVQQAESLRSMEALSGKLSRSQGTLVADIRYSIPVDDARDIVGAAELEPLLANTPVRSFEKRLFVRKSEIEPWTSSFSSRLASRILASSETPIEQLPGMLIDLQKSVSLSLTLRAGGNSQ